MNIRSEIRDIESLIIDWRRDFHQNPELSFKEFKTGKKIADELTKMGLEPKLKIGKTGLIADLKFGDGPMIALRADMDALPIQETSGLSFSSKNKGEYVCQCSVIELPMRTIFVGFNFSELL